MKGTTAATLVGLGLEGSSVTPVSTGLASLALVIGRSPDEGSHYSSCETPSPISGASS